MVNSNPYGFFGSSRYLRQEDLLSPMLFILVMEALSMVMDIVVLVGLLEGFRCSILGVEDSFDDIIVDLEILS